MEVETFQTEWELDRLTDLYETLDVYCALEIGAWYGGSLQRWLGIGKTVVVVDDVMRGAEEWERWAERKRSQLVLLQGLSQQSELVAKAQDLGPYHFIFIDGAHDYGSVRADWENYSPMVAKGGVVAFHDIVPRPHYGVSEVWNEIKSQVGARTMEIVQTVEPDNETKHGIGVVWLDCWR